MRDKGFSTFVTLVIITATVGCDNVAFGGIQVELRPPSNAVGSAEEVAEPELPDPGVAPLDLGPLLYLVERTEGSGANLIPIAALADGVYETLPDPGAPEILERFPIARYEPGSEFTLFAQGVRAGTFVSDGGVGLDGSACLSRPTVTGRIEIAPEAGEQRRYLALARSDAVAVPSAGPFRLRAEDPALRAAAQGLGQRLLTEMAIPFPPSLAATRRDLQPLTLEPNGSRALAVSYVYGDNLVVGPTTPLAYGLFILAEEDDAGYDPLFAWYQRYDRGGKGFPRLVGAHDLFGIGSPEALFEVFGETERWMAIVGQRGGSYRILYQDPCGVPPGGGEVRTFP